MNKTVYFLGAGFSADAGGPIQNGIIKTILSDEFNDCLAFGIDIQDARRDFIDFLENDLNIPRDLWNQVVLEDVFTPMDRCIANGRSFKKHSAKKLVELRERFHLLMGASIQFGLDYSGRHDNQYAYDFARYIDEQAKQKLVDNRIDNIALITTNWDILLDNALNYHVRSYSRNEKDNGENKLAVVDYCCYISSLEDDEFIKPGLLALGRGGYNIKYLKLHGSLNWLHCPMCQRLFVKYNTKTVLGSPQYCKHCERNYKIRGNIDAIKLRGNLLLPTFLKDLSNIQVQLVWQNAGIELSECNKVVFLGYSLPFADFEIRQLLSRCIPLDAEVEVVIYPGSPKNRKERNENEKRIKEEKERFKTFFGNRIRNGRSFILKTIPEYVNSLNV